jgi:hypothetical protein
VTQLSCHAVCRRRVKFWPSFLNAGTEILNGRGWGRALNERDFQLSYQSDWRWQRCLHYETGFHDADAAHLSTNNAKIVNPGIIDVSQFTIAEPVSRETVKLDVLKVGVKLL